jgi:hypothetical protein
MSSIANLRCPPGQLAKSQSRSAAQWLRSLRPFPGPPKRVAAEAGFSLVMRRKGKKRLWRSGQVSTIRQCTIYQPSAQIPPSAPTDVSPRTAACARTPLSPSQTCCILRAVLVPGFWCMRETARRPDRRYIMCWYSAERFLRAADTLRSLKTWKIYRGKLQ